MLKNIGSACFLYMGDSWANWSLTLKNKSCLLLDILCFMGYEMELSSVTKKAVKTSVNYLSSYFNKKSKL